MYHSRLKWQCRRGMRELDVLLSAWLENHYSAASKADKAAFRALLELADPELIGYLIGGETPSEPGIASVVRQIRGHSSP